MLFEWFVHYFKGQKFILEVAMGSASPIFVTDTGVFHIRTCLITEFLIQQVGSSVWHASYRPDLILSDFISLCDQRNPWRTGSLNVTENGSMWVIFFYMDFISIYMQWWVCGICTAVENVCEIEGLLLRNFHQKQCLYAVYNVIKSSNLLVCS